MPKRHKVQAADDEGELTPWAKAEIAAGRRDIAAGRVYTTAEVMRELGLDGTALRKTARKPPKGRPRGKPGSKE